MQKTKKITFIALAAAVMCVLGPISVPIPVSPVPVSLGLFAIYAAVFVLGMRYGTYAVAVYIFLGFAGLPVFSGFSGGAGKLLGPTGGYIIGYIFAALISGFFVDKFENKKILNVTGMLVGTAACYLFGTFWLMYQADLPFGAALTEAVLPFIPADVVKIIAVMLVCPRLRSIVKNL